MVRAASITFLERLLRGFLPTEDGGPPPALDAARARLFTLVASVLGFLLGAAVGLILVLVLWAVRDVPTLLVGLGVGALLGASAVAVIVSRFRFVRRGEGLLVILAPLLLLLAPFILIAGAVAVLVRWPRPRRRTSSKG